MPLSFPGFLTYFNAISAHLESQRGTGCEALPRFAPGHSGCNQVVRGDIIAPGNETASNEAASAGGLGYAK